MKKFEKFIYPESIKKKELFAEDIEQALLEYLEIEDACFQYQDSSGNWITTKCLKIRIKGE